jgi:hypothetical protein
MSIPARTLTLLAGVVVVSAVVVLLTRTARASADYQAADVNVSCAPSQRAVVRRTMTGTTPQVDVLCVDAARAVPAGYAISDGGGLVPVAYSPTAIATPRIAGTSSTRTTVARRDGERRTSWQKRALVIGGSAGAGAGIGALIGGKKGALIGAAIGGGGATIVDQVKRR